jgi:hypothetical protein
VISRPVSVAPPPSLVAAWSCTVLPGVIVGFVGVTVTAATGTVGPVPSSPPQEMVAEPRIAMQQWRNAGVKWMLDTRHLPGMRGRLWQPGHLGCS